MCKVEEKQLEAAIPGDGGGRGRNQNTSGLFKLLLASPCPGSSAGPRGRLRFLFPSHQVDEAPSETLPRGPERKLGLREKHLRRRRWEFFCLLSTCLTFFPPSKNSSLFVKILFFFGHFSFLCLRLAALLRTWPHLPASAVGGRGVAPSLSLSAILPPPLVPH